MKLTSINPYTNSILAEYNELTDQELSLAIDRANASFGSWK
jgi:acyl-CoA reductase-like NAD-dependent aldehyde dehydrogenase